MTIRKAGKQENLIQAIQELRKSKPPLSSCCDFGIIIGRILSLQIEVFIYCYPIDFTRGWIDTNPFFAMAP